MTLERKATIVSSTVATILILIKLTIGILSGSVSVLASAIDSVLDLIVSAFNLFAITKAEEPADEEFNYGRGKIEALAAVIEGTVITVSGLYIFYESIRKAIKKETVELLGVSIWVMIASLVLTIGLVIFLNMVAKKTNNLVIRSDALHYKTDIYSNGAILLALVLIKITGIQIIDSIFGVAIAIYIIYSAYSIIKEGVLMLLDVALDKELVEKIQDIIISENGVTDYHFLKTRRSGKTNFVDVHVVMTPDISLVEAHNISDSIEEKIKELDKESDWSITIHLDPYDDSVEH
ncbi:MAG: cation transporter [Epsilonproteobacteria bacterium]|nr:cation transporter [Campylobacterota bacterium]